MVIRTEMKRNRGFTLFEIIVTVVVIALAATALMSVFSSTVATSADPVLEHQAIAIAEAYMEEIQLKSFTTGPGNTRPTYDDLLDYHGLVDVGARDQEGNAIAGLADYSVAVTVELDSLNLILGGNSLRIHIIVSHASIDPVLLTGYRTNY